MRVLVGWCLAFSFAAILFTFLHECGHGFGAKIDGVSVSTGFNRVGMPETSPRDPDFRSGFMIPGTVTSAFLLGPMVNWLSAALATLLLIRARQFGPAAIAAGAVALANSLARVIPMLLFLVLASFGVIWPEDEVFWGLTSIPELSLPMEFDELYSVAAERPELILGQPLVFFWPTFSLALSVSLLIASGIKLAHLLRAAGMSRGFKLAFFFVPLGLAPILVLTLEALDLVLRINW